MKDTTQKKQLSPKKQTQAKKQDTKDKTTRKQKSKTQGAKKTPPKKRSPQRKSQKKVVFSDFKNNAIFVGIVLFVSLVVFIFKIFIGVQSNASTSTFTSTLKRESPTGVEQTSSPSETEQKSESPSPSFVQASSSVQTGTVLDEDPKKVEPKEQVLPKQPAPVVQTTPKIEPKAQGAQKQPAPEVQATPKVEPKADTPKIQAAPVAKPAPKSESPKEYQGTLIFVFDDAGHNLKQLEPFLHLPFPCTIAVLPGLQYSKQSAQKIRDAGKELILHQPMQALNLKMDPGPGAIQAYMSEQEIREIVRKNIHEVGPIAGLNNHEGSLITEDIRSMAVVLDVVQENNIYFLDSRTTAQTVAPALAQKRGQKIWERAVFLDNSQETLDIIEAVYSGLKIAKKGTPAIMIGHVWSNNLAQILTEMYPELIAEGFSLSTIARIATESEFDE